MYWVGTLTSSHIDYQQCFVCGTRTQATAACSVGVSRALVCDHAVPQTQNGLVALADGHHLSGMVMVQARRPEVAPNFGFLGQLQRYEKEIAGLPVEMLERDGVEGRANAPAEVLVH